MMIDHIRYVPNQQETVYRNIKEKHLPVIVYGAGELALCVTNLLKKHSISPWAYAVDAPYYEQGRFYQGKPIWRFDFLARHPDQFVFVLGIGNPTVVKSFVKRDDICGFVLLSPYGEKAPITYSYLKEHETAFQQTYDWLEDDLSRRTMLAYLNLKISGNVRYNFDVMTSGQYFCECTSDFRGGTFIDCGACYGETVESFITWSKGNYKKIYAIEADPTNAEICRQYLALHDCEDVETVNCAVWHQQGMISFSDDAGTSSKIGEDGIVRVRADTIDHILQGAPVDFLKMDIEGAELNALRGAAESIRAYHPLLAICVYHKSEDLITIPQYLKELWDYRFFLRKHHIADELELVLYGIPRN